MLDTRFRRQAALTPDRVALVDGEDRWTYAQLAGHADRISAWLVAQGVERGDVVALRLPKSAGFVAAYIGILQARAAYLPLSGEPEHRVQAVYARARPAAILDPDSLAEALAFEGPLDHTSGELDDPAYLVFSSGTTGEPKGILCPHRGAVLSYDWRFELRPYGEGHRVGANVFFVWELLRPLLVGATLVVIPDAVIYDPPVLVAFLREHRVHETLFTPSLLRTVLNLVPDIDLPDLQTIYLNGEVVAKDLLAMTMERLDAQIWNLYSASECHEIACIRLDATFLETTETPSFEGSVADTVESAAVAIGPGFPQLALKIIADGRPVPDGQIGELFIDTPCLAIGYLGQPELTAQRFPTLDGRRVYRSGDLAWRDARGHVHLVGRCDSMIKVRGYSVFLGRIEAALDAQPGVRKCALTVRGEGLDKHIVAHVEAHDDAPWAIDALSGQCGPLRSALAELLPAESIPSRFVAWPLIPIDPVSGKTDTAALRARGSAAAAVAEGPLGLFHEVLGFPVRETDTFVGVGGQSLQAAEVSVRLSDLGVEVRVVDLLGTHTVGELLAGAREQTDDLGQEVGRITGAWNLAPGVRARPPTVGRAGRILLTGGTGFLGAFLCDHLLRTTDAEVICLHRGAPERLAAARARRGLDDAMHRVRPVRGDLAEDRLGLDPAGARLAATAELVIHAGALVNYAYPYGSMRGANADGTARVLELAAASGAGVHLISTNAVFPRRSIPCLESERCADLPEPEGGYGQSKWVAERLAEEAVAAGVPVAVYRPANIGPHRATGAGNADDYQTWVWAACLRLGCVPMGTPWLFEFTPVDHLLTTWRRLADGAPWGGVFHLLQTDPVRGDTVFEGLASAFGLERVDRATWDARVAADPHPSMELFRASMPSFEAWMTWPNVFDDRLARITSGLAHPGWTPEDVARCLQRHLQQGTLPVPCSWSGEQAGVACWAPKTPTAGRSGLR